MPSQLSELKKQLRSQANPEKAALFPRYFKAGPGQYGEGDKFLGVIVPLQRKIAKQFKGLSLADVEKLVMSQWHEERLTGLLILVDKYKRSNQADKKSIYDFYMVHTANINNWDLVDSSAVYIVGPWLDDKPNKMEILQKRAKSNLLWDRRIAVLATFAYITQGRADEALVIAEQLLHDTHDLIQKAVGWMLREIGKRVDRQLLLSFLDEHAATMPRTTLRYAIEHLPASQRQFYLNKKSQNY